MHINFFTKEDEYIEAGIKLIADICSKTKKNPSVALSGGSTPKTLYSALSTSNKIPFDKIDFWQVDERYVKKTNQNSNYRLIEQTLLSGDKKPNSFHNFNTSLPLDKCLENYKKDLENNLHEDFDLIILGIGPDGHTASLFPNSDALKETKNPVAHTITDRFNVKDRLTLTFPPLLKSKNILILINGAEKMDTLNELTQGNKSTEDFPAKKLIEHPNLEIFYLH